MEDLIYLLGLHYLGFTHKKLHHIFEKSENYKEIFTKVSASNLSKDGFNSEQIEFILERKKKLNLDLLSKKLDDRYVKIITIKDKDYPEILKNSSNPPYLFYLRGKIDNSPKIAVVGSRKITSYGEKVISMIIPDLSKYFTIISGGAAGCDTCAHEETMKADGITISVIGTGIDLDYPVGNKKIYDKIVETGGAVISIFPLGEIGNAYNFPIRNEIVSALSVGVIVIEAREKSGSLITAKLALEQGKDLFAIPGDINKANSGGCNNLIKNSEAKLVTKSEDILEEYNILLSGNKEIIEKKFEQELDKIIYDLLLLEGLSIDEICEKLSYDISTMSFRTSMMELEGFIKKGSDGKFMSL
ncbi:MAG: DNA-processing protein DprA [Candidatus Gracilibacteria bacterium]|nr:DNA-processing protein DprA [Candidatus Gracilibacteria bacterium]